ncbi:MAG: hypothetical protein HRT43_13000 [Campylobacteraceae bacterium]|nr:hypothetical protein [Campylobacteraceae bacterium]
MKNIMTLLFTFLLSLILAGCATWDGVQEDSADAWDKTKEVSADAWDKTKEVSGDAWDKTKDAVTGN